MANFPLEIVSMEKRSGSAFAELPETLQLWRIIPTIALR